MEMYYINGDEQIHEGINMAESCKVMADKEDFKEATLRIMEEIGARNHLGEQELIVDLI